MAKSLTKRVRRGAGRPSAAETEAHKEAILEAATEVFLRSGFSGSSMAGIADRAGASKGTLYSLYPGKVELFAAIVQRRIATRIRAEDRERLARMDEPAQEALEAFALSLLGWIGSKEARRWQHLVVIESERFPELSEMFWSNGPAIGIDNLTQYFTAASIAGLLNVPEPEEAAYQFLGITVGIHHLRNSLGLSPIVTSEAGIRAWIHRAVETFLHGRQAVPATAKTRKSAGRPFSATNRTKRC